MPYVKVVYNCWKGSSHMARYFNVAIRDKCGDQYSRSDQEVHALLPAHELHCCAASGLVSLKLWMEKCGHMHRHYFAAFHCIPKELEEYNFGWSKNDVGLEDKYTQLSILTHSKMCNWTVCNLYLNNREMNYQWNSAAEDGVTTILGTMTHAVMSPIPSYYYSITDSLQLIQQCSLISLPVDIDGREQSSLSNTI